MSVDPRVRQAIQLIRNGQRLEAQSIIYELVKEQPSNANLWYLAAMASDLKEARLRYLNRALQIQPGHEQAKALLDKLNVPVGSEKLPVSPQAIPKATKIEPPRRSRLTWAMAVISVIVLLVVSNYGSYELGRELQRRDAINTFGPSLGDYATIVPIATEAAYRGATATIARRTFEAVSTALAMDATKSAQKETLPPTIDRASVATPLGASDITLTPGAYLHGKWTVDVRLSPLDDSTEATARLSSNGEGTFSGSSMVIECKQKQLTMYIYLDSVYSFDEEKIQIRLDKNPPRTLSGDCAE